MTKSIDLNEYRGDRGHVHFIGCGGVGTQPMMRIFYERGFRVSGSDLLDNAGTRSLRALGLKVGVGHRAENLPEDDGTNLLVVYTSAAGEDNPELVEGRRRGALCLRRGAALGLMATVYKRVISVSGSHGKTSISAMITAALKLLNAKPGYLIGGTVRGWADNGEAGNGDLFVTEVDESDGTHALTQSYLGVVPNVEDDHSWSVGGVEALYRNFETYAGKAERLIYVGSETTDRLFAGHAHVRRLTADPKAIEERKLFRPEVLSKWGTYQQMNVLTALAALQELGFDTIRAVQALEEYPGVERRMSLRFQNNRYRVIEDYAHHPTELTASISALRELNPGRRLVVVFQPHRYARLERYFTEFAAQLKRADRVFVTPVFAAWTASGKYNSGDLAKAAGTHSEAVCGSWEEIGKKVHGELQDGDTVAVIGAGDLKDILPFLEE